MKRIIVLALVICGVAMTARAQSDAALSGNELYEQCRGGKGDFGLWFCIGYMEGIRAGLQVGSETHLAKDICIPKDVSTGHLQVVVQRYLKHLPGRDRRAMLLVSVILSEAWPCPK